MRLRPAVLACVAVLAAACGPVAGARGGGPVGTGPGGGPDPGAMAGMGPGMMGGGYGAPAPTGSAPANAERVRLEVNPPPLGGVRNPQGRVVDAFVPATFRMVVGVATVVTVLNYDTAPHTWTSPGLGVNRTIPAGSPAGPSRTAFVVEPRRAGTFEWFCETPCDRWSMTHDGYMRGTVSVSG